MSEHGVTKGPTYYKYVSAEVAKLVLASRQLKWTSPLEFDDPFDVRRDLHFGFTELELDEAINQEIARRIEHGETDAVYPPLAHLLRHTAGLPAARRLEIAARSRSEWNARAESEYSSFAMLREFWEKIVPTYRILCLSESVDVTAMWALYADNHTGAVLAFAAASGAHSPFRLARKVEYSDAHPSIASTGEWVACLLDGGLERLGDFFEELEYRKAEEWAYQREVRVVAPGMRPGESGTHSLYKFDSNDLVGIYFGLRTAEVDRSELGSLAGTRFPHARLFAATMSSNSNRFEFSEVRQHRTDSGGLKNVLSRRVAGLVD